MNDDFLYKYRKAPRREYAAALYQRITKPMNINSRTRVFRAAALSFAVIAITAAVLFFSPSTRALADGLIHQFGGYIFVQGTPQPDTAKEAIKKQMDGQKPKISPQQEATLTAEKMQMKDQPSIKPNPADAASKPASALAPDAAAASQQAGFPVLAPAYVPAGYTPGDEKDITGGWEIAHENGGIAVRTHYQNQADKSFLVIEELKYGNGQPRTVERPQIVDVTVRGQPGAWMPDEGGKSTLAWDENGITYLVVSNTLSKEEMLKVAESLGK